MMEKWRKSSYSEGHGGNCLEVRWHKSSYSSGHNPNCVECRTTTANRIDMRDSQHRSHGYLSFPLAEWRALLGSLRRGEV